MKMLATIVICASIAVPFAASAQMTDAAYCDSLAAAYRKDHGAGAATSTDVAQALGACQTNAKGSIPVLEKALTDEKITVPKRM